MPKKKPPRNAFYFFMLDFKARCERNGERFPNGLRDVQEEAGPEWNNMTTEAKKKYEDMAKEEKARLKGDTARKETCWHNSFDTVEKEKRDKEEAKIQMNSFIESTIMSLSNKKMMAEYKFYAIHVNYFCISEGECYHPAELALCEFCLGDGVTSVYHTIIDPGQIPLGYRHEACEKSNTTHKIPIEDNGGEKNFYNIFTEIKKFMQPGIAALGGDYPPLYTLSDNVNLNTSMKAVKSVIDTLCSSDSYEYENVDKYRVYPIEKLFLELRNACTKQANDEEHRLPNVGLARLELEKDVYNFTRNIACEFHQMEDAVEFCSKSYVQRWVYLICDFCCQFLDIVPIPGRHLPENADINFSARRKVKEQEEKPIHPKDFTWQSPDEAKKQSWVAVEQPPLPRPTRQANLAALLPRNEDQIDLSSFPSLEDGSFAIGRGRHLRGRGGRGGGSSKSFASAMKK